MKKISFLKFQKEQIMRKHYIEYLRVIAMFAVVAIHVCSVALNGFEDYSQLDAVLYLSVSKVFHFAVPIFFMISGALMLSPDKELPLKKLLSRYLLKYGLVIVVFGWAFAGIERFFVSRKVSVDLFTGSFVDMLTGKTWNHMWYMYSLFGAMLVVPILRWIIKNCRKEFMYYILAVFSLFLMVLPVMENNLGFELGVTLPFSSVYCFYMLLGYWIDHEDIRIPKKIAVVLMAVMFSVIIILIVLQQVYHFNTRVLLYYSSPVIGVFSVCIFSFFRSMESALSVKKTPVFIQFLGKYSFGVYIIHMFWINIAYKALKINPFKFNSILAFFVLLAAVSLLSILTSWAMKHIPLLKKIV